jgi:hypothetical protein
MKKRLIILSVSILIIISAGLSEINYLDKTSRYVLSDLEYSKNLIENNNFESAKSGVDSLEETWGDIKTVWAIFVDHDEIGYIEERITAYKANIEQGKKEESLIASEELKRMFNHVVNKQRVRVENII